MVHSGELREWDVLFAIAQGCLWLLDWNMDWNGGMDYGMDNGIFVYSRWHLFVSSLIQEAPLLRVGCWLCIE